MQNYGMIESIREGIAPLLKSFKEGKDLTEAQEKTIEGSTLDVAVNVRRGLRCGRTSMRLCFDCNELQTDIGVCDWMQQNDLLPGVIAVKALYVGDI